MKKIFILYICQLPYLSMNNNYIKNFQKYLKLQTNRTKKKDMLTIIDVNLCKIANTCM